MWTKSPVCLFTRPNRSWPLAPATTPLNFLIIQSHRPKEPSSIYRYKRLTIKQITQSLFNVFELSFVISRSALPQEAEMLRSISFHPSGDFLLVGTQHPTLRLYDVNTFQCFVSCNPLDQHTDTISGVCYNPSANSYVTCSKDGSIKLWDGVSNRCVTTFDKAHDGAEVCSAVFSKNSKYILSSGKDSVAKLWEISTGRTLVKYTGERRSVQRNLLIRSNVEIPFMYKFRSSVFMVAYSRKKRILYVCRFWQALGSAGDKRTALRASSTTQRTTCCCRTSGPSVCAAGTHERPRGRTYSRWATIT